MTSWMDKVGWNVAGCVAQTDADGERLPRVVMSRDHVIQLAPPLT